MIFQMKNDMIYIDCVRAYAIYIINDNREKGEYVW